MTDKTVKGSAGEGGGGGGGGGGVPPGVGRIGNNGSGGLHWLLPNIAEAVEVLDGATVQDVQSKIEELTSVKYSKSELASGLENGTQLGLFQVERKFAVNPGYLNRALKTDKCNWKKTLTTLVKKKLKEDRELAKMEDFAKSGKMSKRIRKKGNRRGTGARQKMCDRCKKKISVIAENKSEEDTYYDSASDRSLTSDTSKPRSYGKRSGHVREGSTSKRKKMSSPSPQENNLRASNRQPQELRKSKLLVERNPLENEPPHCMFT